MYCPTCGNQTSLDQKYCRSCGMGLQMISQAVGEHQGQFIEKHEGSDTELKDVFAKRPVNSRAASVYLIVVSSDLAFKDFATFTVSNARSSPIRSMGA